MGEFISDELWEKLRGVPLKDYVGRSEGQVAAPNARSIPRNTSGVPSPPPGGRRRNMAMRGETLGAQLNPLCSVCNKLAITRVIGPKDVVGYCCRNERCASSIVTHLMLRERLTDPDVIQFESVAPIRLTASEFLSFLASSEDG